VKDRIDLFGHWDTFVFVLQGDGYLCLEQFPFFLFVCHNCSFFIVSKAVSKVK